MKYPPMEARCVFIDGPVAVYLHEASEAELLACYERLGRLVAVAAKQLSKVPDAQSSRSLRPVPCPRDDNWGSAGRI